MSSYLESNMSSVHISEDIKYKRQLKVDENKENALFVQNKYVQQKCKASRIVCFSVTTGMTDIKQSKSGYDIQGKLY
jgi:hypothetical protein